MDKLDFDKRALPPARIWIQMETLHREGVEHSSHYSSPSSQSPCTYLVYLMNKYFFVFVSMLNRSAHLSKNYI